MSRHRCWVVVLAMLVLSACAGIPSSGPVTRVEDDPGLGGSTVRYSPTGPIEGGSPEQIVRGFLDAMLAYPTSTRTAEAFLVPESAQNWNPSTSISVYSAPSVSGGVSSSKSLDEPRGSSRDGVDVQLSFVLESVLDMQGRYTHRGTSESVTYRLKRIDGEWRIVNPPEGLMVNAKFFSDYIRPFNIYYFDLPGRRLVADPVHLMVGEQLATNLVTSLVRGQSKTLAEATRTYVPPLSDLRPSVPVSREGVAEVEFATDLNAMSDGASDRMAAQLVWTLRQVPSIEAVQILGETASVLGGRQTIQPVSSWGGFGPPASRGRVNAVIDDRVVQIESGKVSPLSGVWGKDARKAEFIAVSDNGVAGVLEGGNEVRVTRRNGSRALTIFGRDFIAPQWDTDAKVWLVDSGTSGTRVRVGPPDDLRTIAAPDLDGRVVNEFVVSPDGARYAAGVRAGGDRSIRVGTVLRDSRDRIVGLGPSRKVFTTAVNPRAISWSSSTEVSFLANGREGAQVTHAAIDGSSTITEVDRGAAALPDAGIVSLVIGIGEVTDHYATDSTGRLWFRPADAPWRVVKTAPVTVLAAGV